MKRVYILIVTSLLISLFIYLFYRTENTVVTALFIKLISIGSYSQLRATITEGLPLHEFIIYSLPEGLWMLCITITSAPLFVRINKLKVKLVYIPIIYCILLELMQLLNLTNGRFDFIDIMTSVVFWCTAMLIYPNRNRQYDLLKSDTATGIIIVLGYAIVYLSHVYY